MGDTNTDFVISIKTLADLAAANQTVAVLKQSVELARAAGRDTNALDSALKKVTDSIASVKPGSLGKGSAISPEFTAGLQKVVAQVPGPNKGLGGRSYTRGG